jgi:ribose transport system substrate-binding protein
MKNAFVRALACGTVLAGIAAAGAASASDNKIALIPGGPHPYFAPWEQAAADAAKDFGIASVEYKVPSEWKLALQTELVESSPRRATPPSVSSPADAGGRQLDRRRTESLQRHPGGGAGRLRAGPDRHRLLHGDRRLCSAYLGTKALIEAMGGKGAVVHLAGLLVDPNTTLRVQAVEKAVAETNGAVTLLQTVGDTDAQEARATRRSMPSWPRRRTDRRHDRHRLHFVGGGGHGAAQPRRQAIKFIGIDDDKIVLDGIKDGFVSGTMAQNPYGQGYIGAYVWTCSPAAAR